MSTVTLYKGINYTGESLELSEGISDLPSSWYKQVVSVKVPGNMRIRLYNERTPADSILIKTDDPDLEISGWARESVKYNVENLSETEEFSNCNTRTNKSSLLLMLIIGVVIGLLLPKLLEKNNFQYNRFEY